MRMDAILGKHIPTVVGLEGKQLDKVRLVLEELEMERGRGNLPESW